MKNKTIKFNLIENARDSLFHAVEHLTDRKEPSPGDYKRVIVDIAHVIELILKERLRRVHPAFIFKNIDKYPVSDARTVSTGKAISRLRSIAGVELDEISKKTIAACKNLRNQIEHFEFEIESKEARAIIGRLLSFIFVFSKTHLDQDFEADFRDDITRSVLADIHEFWRAHGPIIEQRAQDEGREVIDCPACGRTTFDFDSMECIFCGHIEEMSECNVCGEMVWESDIESFEHTTGDINMCQDCISKDAAADLAFEAYREEH